ncbi:MAG TPA: hypothetical protein VJB05_04285 [archaeon]|nr:hypothetical protein [archaeon]
MKGFARIFEAIIASVIILTSLTFFFVPNIKGSEWEDTTIQILAQDALESIYLNGTLTRYVNTDNKTQLNVLMSQMLPKTVDFSFEVSGTVNNIINIVCVDCTSGDVDELKAIMNPLEFDYKERKISIRVQSLTLSINAVPSDTNILFFFNKNLITTYESKINSTLSNGGSIVLLSDITQQDVQGTIGKLFNLTWSSPVSATSKFDDLYDGRKVSHNVARYYANISGKNLADISTVDFTVFHASNVKADNDFKNIAKPAGINSNAFVRANYNIVNANGRSVWISDYTRTDHNDRFTKAIDNLTKASVMWASGEKFKLDIIKKDPAVVNFRTGILVFDKDVYVVELIVWRIYF